MFRPCHPAGRNPYTYIQTSPVHCPVVYMSKTPSGLSAASCPTSFQSCDTPTPETLPFPFLSPFPFLFMCCFPVTSMLNAAVLEASPLPSLDLFQTAASNTSPIPCLFPGCFYAECRHESGTGINVFSHMPGRVALPRSGHAGIPDILFPNAYTDRPP